MKHRIAAVLVFGLLRASPVAAHPAWGIVVDHQGQIYFSDLETVWKRDVQGRVTEVRAGVRGRHVHDLTIDAADAIYGIDVTYDPATQRFPRALWKLSATGDFAYLVPETADLRIGRGIWMDSTGATYSVESYSNEHKEAKIIRRTPDGATAVLAGGAFGHRDGPGSTARFGMITDIAFATDDTAYLTDGGAIRRIDRAGNVSTLFGAADASRLFGLAVDRGGSVVAADTGGRRVLRVAADGTSTVIATSEAPWSPAGVALHGRDVYILESWYDARARSGTRVRSVAPDGTVTVLAGVGAPLPVPATPTTSRSLGVLAGLTVGLLATAVAIRQLRRHRRER